AIAPSLWPLAAHAQQLKRVGVLMADAATSPTGQTQVATFVQGLRKLGWIEGQNLQAEVRWTAADPTLIQAFATDLVELFKPDVLLSAGTANLLALRRATKTISIVFTLVGDPVEQGLVPNLRQPGGQITGFASNEFSIAGKWADLLKQMVPSIARIAFISNPTDPPSPLYLRAAEAAGRSLGVEIIAAPVLSTAELEATLARVAREPNVGLIVPLGA